MLCIVENHDQLSRLSKSVFQGLFFLYFLLSLFSFLLPIERNNDSDTEVKRAFLFFNKAVSLFRLNIPPFVPARTVLEGLEAEDLLEKEKPVKNYNTGKKVKEPKHGHTHLSLTTLPFITLPFFILLKRPQTKLKRERK